MISLKKMMRILRKTNLKKNKRPIRCERPQRDISEMWI